MDPVLEFEMNALKSSSSPDTAMVEVAADTTIAPAADQVRLTPMVFSPLLPMIKAASLKPIRQRTPSPHLRDYYDNLRNPYKRQKFEPKKPKVIFHLVRHGHGRHQLPRLRTEHRASDAPLTTFGKLQCATLSSIFPHMDEVNYILTSPLRRAIQTAMLSFVPALNKGIQCIAYPDLREMGRSSSNIGSTPPVLQEMWGHEGIDFKLCEDGWESGSWDEDHCGLETIDLRRRARVQRVKRSLWEFGQAAISGGEWNGIKVEKFAGGDEIHIAVVSHARFLCSFTGCRNEYPSTFDNCEFRSYRFSDKQEEIMKSGAGTFDLERAGTLRWWATSGQGTSQVYGPNVVDLSTYWKPVKQSKDMHNVEVKKVMDPTNDQRFKDTLKELSKDEVASLVWESTQYALQNCLEGKRKSRPIHSRKKLIASYLEKLADIVDARPEEDEVWTT